MVYIYTMFADQKYLNDVLIEVKKTHLNKYILWIRCITRQLKIQMNDIVLDLSHLESTVQIWGGGYIGVILFVRLTICLVRATPT